MDGRVITHADVAVFVELLRQQLDELMNVVGEIGDQFFNSSLGLTPVVHTQVTRVLFPFIDIRDRATALKYVYPSVPFRPEAITALINAVESRDFDKFVVKFKSVEKNLLNVRGLLKTFQDSSLHAVSEETEP
jgi:hypothetical protein